MPRSSRRSCARPAWAASALTLAVCTAPAALAQEAVIGRVKTSSGAAVIVRQQTERPATVGAILQELDTLRTGADGRLGVTLTDDTRVALGPMTEVRLSRYAYSPGEGRLAVVLGILRGVAAYVSGQIARLSPEAVRIETPDAVIGVRGTQLAIRVGDE
jgi:hypothetical protein